MCDRLVLDSGERDDRQGALLDAHMTAVSEQIIGLPGCVSLGA
jgi:hypothetical protein